MAAKPAHISGTSVFLVRHYKPLIQGGICYGHTDIPAAPISPSARTHLLTQLPSSTAVFSSPLQRCSALAHSLFPVSSIGFNPLLMELNFGDWEMAPWDNIECAQLDAWASDNLNFSPPQGESFNDLCLRVRRFVREELKSNEPTIIITHGGVIKAFLYLFADMPLQRAVAHRVEFGSVTRIVLDDNLT